MFIYERKNNIIIQVWSRLLPVSSHSCRHGGQDRCGSIPTQYCRDCCGGFSLGMFCFQFIVATEIWMLLFDLFAREFSLIAGGCTRKTTGHCQICTTYPHFSVGSSTHATNLGGPSTFPKCTVIFTQFRSIHPFIVGYCLFVPSQCQENTIR